MFFLFVFSYRSKAARKKITELLLPSTSSLKSRSIKLHKTRTLVMSLQNLEEDITVFPLGREEIILERYDICQGNSVGTTEADPKVSFPSQPPAEVGPFLLPTSAVTALPERIHSIGQTRHFSSKPSVRQCHSPRQYFSQQQSSVCCRSA